MKTTAIYLEDSYAKEMDAQVLEVITDGENRWRLILDKTVFYPMEGGQPTDQGELASDNWNGKVYQVMIKDGEINHYVESIESPEINSTVHGTLNWDRRYKNMKMHSSGHVVDFAMYLLGYSPNQLTPLKGDHGKKAYIVYSGTLEKDISKELEEKSNELVNKGLNFSSKLVQLVDLEKEAIYLQPGLPTDKPLRELILQDVGSVADGGTQVKNTNEIGKITITSILEQDGNTVVNYTLS